MIETIAAVGLLALLITVVSRLALGKVESQKSIDTQYSLLAVDAFMADIYRDYHNAVSLDLHEEGSGLIVLTFETINDEQKVYSYDPSTRVCYINGAAQFRAEQFEIYYNNAQLSVTVKLPQENVISFETHR